MSARLFAARILRLHTLGNLERERDGEGGEQLLESHDR